LNHTITDYHIQVIKNYSRLPQIECYPGKLNQVFMNIINNSIHAIAAKKYTEEKGTITISTRYADEQIEISIKDNGIGIPSSNLNKIFEPFFTTKQVGTGTGLGLSIVYGIINSHHGKISVNSEENRGAEFVISLPLDHR